MWGVRMRSNYLPRSVFSGKEKTAINCVVFLIKWVSSSALRRQRLHHKENKWEGTCWYLGFGKAVFQGFFSPVITVVWGKVSKFYLFSNHQRSLIIPLDGQAFLLFYRRIRDFLIIHSRVYCTPLERGQLMRKKPWKRNTTHIKTQIFFPVPAHTGKSLVPVSFTQELSLGAACIGLLSGACSLCCYLLPFSHQDWKRTIQFHALLQYSGSQVALFLSWVRTYLSLLL